jgi:hypothetical protein
MGEGVTGKASITPRWYNYYPSTYTIRASAGENGTISPSGNITVSPGSSRTFTITPAAGYDIQQVFLNGLNIGVLDSYSFTNIRGDHTIAVTFTESEN